MSDRLRVILTITITAISLLAFAWVAYLVYLQPATICTTFEVVTKAPLW